MGRGGPGVEKQTWGAEEDARLTALVAVHGVKAWKVVGEAIGGGRNGKQCRERWHNHLDPDVRKGPWSSEEDAVVLESHRLVGNAWARIAERLPGRTDMAVKNRW